MPPPGGESLKDTVARVLPYYMHEILPRVMRGERVLVAAHGNSLRALVMVLDGLTSETIPSLELATGIPLVYRLNADTTVAEKQVLTRERIRLLTAEEAECARRAALAEILADCVAGGASVSFMWPYSSDDAYRWWGGIVESVAAVARYCSAAMRTVR